MYVRLIALISTLSQNIYKFANALTSFPRNLFFPTRKNLQNQNNQQKTNATLHLQVSVLNSIGLIRSICVSPNGYWVAVGQASGLLTVLDVRTGMVLASWKGHEAEVLQLSAINDNILLSSSLDQTVSAWNVSDGKFKFHMK